MSVKFLDNWTRGEKKSLQGQTVGLRNTLLEDDPTWMRDDSKIPMLGMCFILVIQFCFGAAVMWGYMHHKYKDWTPPKATACFQCHQRDMMSKYFKRNGSKSPEVMADAVLKTRSPRLLAAIAKIESSGNHNVRNTGYKRRHSGAFQVSAKDWGRVSHDPAEQALQAERILEELTTTMSIKKALATYGGDSTDKYGRKVLAEMRRVP